MVLYVEACESGSMFDSILPDDMNGILQVSEKETALNLVWIFYSSTIFVSVFVMTAADPRESSFACYYDKLRGTYLGDVFSVKWMEDSDVVSYLDFSPFSRDTDITNEN